MKINESKPACKQHKVIKIGPDATINRKQKFEINNIPTHAKSLFLHTDFCKMLAFDALSCSTMTRSQTRKSLKKWLETSWNKIQIMLQSDGKTPKAESENRPKIIKNPTPNAKLPLLLLSRPLSRSPKLPKWSPGV